MPLRPKLSGCSALQSNCARSNSYRWSRAKLHVRRCAAEEWNVHVCDVWFSLLSSIHMARSRRVTATFCLRRCCSRERHSASKSDSVCQPLVHRSLQTRLIFDTISPQSGRRRIFMSIGKPHPALVNSVFICCAIKTRVESGFGDICVVDCSDRLDVS